MTVTKRNGNKVKFDKEKIVQAISKAMNSANHYDKKIAEKIATEIENLNKDMNVEEIGDLVEKKLMTTSYKDVAQEYVRYRHQRNLIRETEKTNDSILNLIELQNKEILEENSNKNAIIASTQRDYMAGEVSKDLSMRLLLPPDIVKAHNEGIIHFHKLIVA